ncbi:bystin [Acrasis kona]|uniref:Bystin n=1 Tax=Acrasis kona TaxID=1008807 RepID=A0AAW2ZD65_9EUKA
MPKVMKAKKAAKQKQPRHDPLAHDILSDTIVVDKKDRNAKKKLPKNESSDEEDNVETMDVKTSRKILQAAKKQSDEFQNEQDAHQRLDIADDKFDDEISDEEDEEDEVVELAEDDEEALGKFMGDGSQKKTLDLSAIILQKIREKEQLQNSNYKSETVQDVQDKVHPKVATAYKKIGSILASYTSGKVPKAFKVIPSLANWEEIIVLTHPEKWSNQAFFQATKIFVTNTNVVMCQRFLNMILLPKIRLSLLPSSIHQSKQMKKMKLNHHLYESLIKACSQPPAFFKGIVIPLCEQDCTLQEAVMVCSAVKKSHLPSMHSSAALHLLCQMPFTSITQLFIKTILEKRYALPLKVIDSLVESFYRFHDKDKHSVVLPVVWHQSLLHLVQIYKREFTKEQKKKVYEICKKHSHHIITPIIRKELNTNISIYDKKENDSSLNNNQEMKVDNEQEGDDDDDEMVE